jgi:hypothetical protein
MTRRTKLILAGALVAIGLIGILATMAFADTARKYISGHYHRVGNDQGADVYSSPRSATLTAQEITTAVTPGDRRTTASGVFLRYSGDFVAVLPQAGGGSRIEVSNERSGYNHFYSYVGGYWGTYSGAAQGFRGGGPGAGK